MTDSPDTSDGTARARLDEDDHDLLTFGEVGERLRIEITRAQSELDAHTAAGDAAAIDVARNRLARLRAAAQRNSAQPINDANFERFFGYPGKAKRNLDVTVDVTKPGR